MKYLKYFENELIYKTHRGEIYKHDDKILKITKDVIEYNNALILINNPSKYFIKYYSAKKISDDKFELIMEKIIPLNDDESDMVDLIQNTLGIEEYMLDDNKRYNFIKELKNNPEYYEDFCSFNEIINMINLLKKMYIEAKYRNIKLYDLRSSNIGKTIDNNIVHFDLGAG
jgi:hypothetical protein